MSTPVYRIGFGYDAHRFSEGRRLVLGGVEIPSERGLDGHSDADVLVHAIMDALLGAASLGDIGLHFPNTDLRYAGASSLELLHQVAGLLHDAGYAVANVDATLIMEHPKISPFVGQMRERIAGGLGIASAQVSVKATTNEGLGAFGAGAGAAAHAVTLLIHHEPPACTTSLHS